MKVDKKKLRPIWLDPNQAIVNVIDQRQLPHTLEILKLTDVDGICYAISEMVVRGAPLIGATAAFGVYFAVREAETLDALKVLCTKIKAVRPTAINLAWAVDRVWQCAGMEPDPQKRISAARDEALRITAEEVNNCRLIGINGLALIRKRVAQKGLERIRILTHCNAGWLACIEYGTATAPIYAAADAGIETHVWVDETRPLNQGARLTAWELGEYGISHTVICDNAGGHLMQHDMVDLVIVGTDRTTYSGDVANKIGTYLKALAAHDNGIPFYVALPSSTFDWTISDGIKEIPIEERDADEVRYVQGVAANQNVKVLIPPPKSPAANYAFDVTPARLVTGFITERGICKATAKDILALFPEKKDCNTNIEASTRRG